MRSSSAFLFITNGCNLACEHCYVSSGPGVGNHMTEDQFERILEILVANKITDVRLTGGEPTVHPNFLNFVSRLNEVGVRPRLITNGIQILNKQAYANVLENLSGCWVSVYGLTEMQHKKIGGKNVKSIKDILSFSTSLPVKSWIGISALLSEVTLEELRNFIEMVRTSGIKKVRFLFSEASGRAIHTDTIFKYGKHVNEILVELKSIADQKVFDFMSIGDPFDFDFSNSKSAATSCLLKDRNMWSFGTDGGIYSCCFNIGKLDHLIMRIDDPRSFDLQGVHGTDQLYASLCEGLSPRFWRSKNIIPKCPISAHSF